MNQNLGTYVTIMAGEDIDAGCFVVAKGRKGSKLAFMLTSKKTTKSAVGVSLNYTKKGETAYVAVQGHCQVVCKP